MEPDFESLRRDAEREISQRMDAIGEMMRRVRRLQADARASMSTADSRDRLISVTVNAAGVPIAIELDSSVYSRYTPSELAAEILAVSQDAAADVQKKPAVIVQQIQAAAALDTSESIIPAIPGIQSLMEAARPSFAPPQAESRLRRNSDLDLEDHR